MVAVMSTSGVIVDKYSLNANESNDRNSLSTKLFTYDFSDLPSTESIMCLKRVVSAELCALVIFSLAFTSKSISLSSLPVNNLNSICLLEFGRSKENLFSPFGCLLKSISTDSNFDKSTSWS